MTSEKIINFCGDGSRFGINILYSYENSLLGTAGAVKKLSSFFNDTLIVVYGDVFPNFHLTNMIRFHFKVDAIATLAIAAMSNPWEGGVVEIDQQSKIINFKEKPAIGEEIGNLVNGGVYILKHDILNYIPSEIFSDFAIDIFPELIKLDLPVYGYILKSENSLIDIGTLAKYNEVNERLKVGSLKISYA